MKLTSADKLILILLSEIHENLGIQGGVDTKLITESIYSGNTWALSWEFSGVISGESDNTNETPMHVNEVVDILDMYSFIENAYDSLSNEDKNKIETTVDTVIFYAKFRGFDGNNEPKHYNAANFLIKQMGRFEIFKDRSLNSHSEMLPRYSNMLKIFNPIRAKLADRSLSCEEIVTLLKVG